MQISEVEVVQLRKENKEAGDLIHDIAVEVSSGSSDRRSIMLALERLKARAIYMPRLKEG